MTPKAFICFVIASVFMMMAGSYIGNIMSFLVEALTGIRQVNVVDSVVRSYPVWLIVIVVVVLAPVTEEFMFRKLLIDRLSRYGTVFSVLISGIVFGAFHGNFYQFFYGSMIGCLLAWVYCTYAKLRYCIFIHAILNFIGTVVPLFILGSNPQTEIIRSIVSYMYSLFVVASIPLGIIMIGLYAKKIRFLISDGVLIRPEKTLSKNAGFIVYIVFVLLLFALNILG